MALELINCPEYKLQLHQHSYLRSTIILILSLFMVPLGCPCGGWTGLGTATRGPTVLPTTLQICLMIGMAHVLVVYRVLAAAAFSSSALPFLEEQVTTAVVVTGALVHYVIILILTKVSG